MSRKARKRAGDPSIMSGHIGSDNLGLKPPYPSSPYYPPKHTLYLTKGESFAAYNFAQTYSAKKFLDMLLQDDEIHLTTGVTGNEDTIVSSTGIKVRADDIEEIINHKLTNAEDKWELPEGGNGGTAKGAMDFRMCSGLARSAPSNDNDEKPARVKREKKERTPRPSKEGLITVADIAAEMKLEPRVARAALRAANTPKPPCGWAWAKTEVDGIKKIIHDNL